MSLGAPEDDSALEIRLHPAEIGWHMLNKSRFFFLSAALFSGVSAALYPAVVLKTRQQVSASQTSYFKTSFSIVRAKGFHGFYCRFGTLLVGTIPAQAVYMAALEVTERSLVEEGGLRACYRGLGPRCSSMAMSAATMVTTYEFLKKLSA